MTKFWLVVWVWMRGIDGIAAAQWASAVLSMFAIFIALFVFLSEQRRDNAARMIELRRETDAVNLARQSQIDIFNANVDICLTVTDEAIGILQDYISNLPTDQMSYVGWNFQSQPPLALQPVRAATEVILNGIHNNAKLALATAKVLTAIERACADKGAILSNAARQHATILVDDMTKYREEIQQCRL